MESSLLDFRDAGTRNCAGENQGSGVHRARQVSPRPFIIAVVIGASACFATPIGYQTNTLVYGAGGCLFRDFIQMGLPLNVLLWLVASFLIPWLYPFTP